MFQFRPIALNQNTCMRLNILDFIKFAKQFDEVELHFNKIHERFSKSSQLKDLVELLAIYNTKITSIFPLEDFCLCSDRDYKHLLLNDFKLMLDYSDKLESNLIVANPFFGNDPLDINNIPKWRILKRTRKRLEDIAKRAYKEDVNIGFQYSSLKQSAISSLKEAIELLGPLESQENLGYVIDSFEIGTSMLDLNEIKPLKNLLYLIKLADFDEFSLENVNRLFPGQGNFDFTKFYRFLESIGYNRSFSIELSPNECSEKLLEKFSSIFKKV